MCRVLWLFQIRAHILRSKLYAVKIPQKSMVLWVKFEVSSQWTVVRFLVGLIVFLVVMWTKTVHQDQDGQEHQEVKEVWSLWQMLLKKIIVQHVKNFFKSHWSKKSQENAQEPTSVARGWVSHSPWQRSPVHRHVVNKTLRDHGWEVLIHAPYSPVLSPADFDLFLKLKEPMRGWRFSFLKRFLPTRRYPRYLTHE